MAAVLAVQGDCRRAARLFGAGEAFREAVGASVLPVYRTDYDRGLNALSGDLRSATLRALWSEGRAMTVERAVTYALANPRTRTRVRSASDGEWR